MNQTLELSPLKLNVEVIEHEAIGRPVARRRRVWMWIGIVALVSIPVLYYFAMTRPCGCAPPPVPPMPCCTHVVVPFPEPPVSAVL